MLSTLGIYGSLQRMGRIVVNLLYKTNLESNMYAYVEEYTSVMESARYKAIPV